MEPQPDFRDLLREFNAAGVEYLIVGAHALAAHGFVRAPRDLDVWVRPSPENAKRVMSALESFGAPLTGMVAEDFASGEIFYRIGVEPVQIAAVLVQPQRIQPQRGETGTPQCFRQVVAARRRAAFSSGERESV